MSYGLYVVGFLIIIGGLIYGAVLLHVPPQWIAVGSLVLLGIAVVKGVKATRQKDPSKN
jgi:xanthine/uracil/vitamin C permease (AzgA family)